MENINDKDYRAFEIDKSDNVATALVEIPKGKLRLLGECHEDSMECTEKIPAGHKVAVCDISQNEMIMKYGIPIGKATADIKKGQWVHLHCMKSNYDERSAYLDVITGAPKDIEY